jgi:hypothetical protein
MSSMAMGMMPGQFLSPFMVKVLPLEVCPGTNTFENPKLN